MQPDAMILGRTEINVDTLMATCKQAFGRSISRTLDSQGRDTDSPPAYLTMLAAMRNPDAEMLSTLEDPGHLLQHVSYTLLVICEPTTRIDLIQRTPLHLQFGETVQSCDLCVVSGNLENWRTSVINCCSDVAPYNTRLLFDKILVLFESEGLGKMWSHFAKKQLPDRTIKLLERK
jgi:hypothetical protein